MSERKEPSFIALIAFGIIAVSIIIITFPLLGLGKGVEFIACAAAGWYARRIVMWLADVRDAVLVKLNEWAKGG